MQAKRHCSAGRREDPRGNAAMDGSRPTWPLPSQESVSQPAAKPLRRAVCHWLNWHCPRRTDRKSTRLNSSHTVISYAVFCLKKKKQHTQNYLETDAQLDETLEIPETYRHAT